VNFVPPTKKCLLLPFYEPSLGGLLVNIIRFYDRTLFPFTIRKSKLTVLHFLKTYDTYAFMANFMVWDGLDWSVYI